VGLLRTIRKVVVPGRHHLATKQKETKKKETRKKNIETIERTHRIEQDRTGHTLLMLPLALWTPTVRICTKPVTRAFHDVFHDETWPADSDEHELHMVMLVCLMFGSFATCTCAPPSNVAVAPGKASTFVGSSKFENVLENMLSLKIVCLTQRV
jgi:hypothetical protein